MSRSNTMITLDDSIKRALKDKNTNVSALINELLRAWLDNLTGKIAQRTTIIESKTQELGKLKEEEARFSSAKVLVPEIFLRWLENLPQEPSLEALRAFREAKGFKPYQVPSGKIWEAWRIIHGVTPPSIPEVAF